MSQDLVQRIKAVNAESEKVNKRSVEAKAKRKLLLEQISEKVSEVEEEYGISFPSISDLEEFDAFLKEMLDNEEGKLQKEVERAEKVNELINSGNISEAQELLGYKPIEKTPLKDEAIKDSVEEEENSEELTDEEVTTQEENEDVVTDLEDEEPVEAEVTDDGEDEVIDGSTVEEEVEEEVIKPRPRKRPTIKTSDFDMGVSLDDLDEVAEEEPTEENTPKAVREDVLEEEEEELRFPVRRRRVIIEDDLEEEEVVVRPKPKPANPVKSGGSFSWD